MMTLLTLLMLPFAFVANADELFPALDNYCEAHDCSNGPILDQPPKTVFVIHGMDNSANGVLTDSKGKHMRFGAFPKIAAFLEDLAQGGANVYVIDYNSDGLRGATNTPIHIYKLKADLRDPATTCSGKGDPKNYADPARWSNCWEIVGSSSQTFSYLDAGQMSLRNISTAIRDVMVTMKTNGTIEDGPVTLIGHSMGGLVLRDLLYGPGVLEEGRNISGYEYLRNRGILINEYISISTPHYHGLFATDEGGNLTEMVCKTGSNASAAEVQYCNLIAWTDALKDSGNWAQQNLKIDITQKDFPQIHWVASTGLGMNVISDAGDGAVSRTSGFFLDQDSGKTRFDVYLPLLEFKHASSAKEGIPAYIKEGNSNHGKQYCDYYGYSEQQCYDYVIKHIDAVHSTVHNISNYPTKGTGVPGNGACEFHNVTDPNNYNLHMSIGCNGWFQYIVPYSTMCLLPGYTDDMQYYKDNPEFKPSVWACKVMNK